MLHLVFSSNRSFGAIPLALLSPWRFSLTQVRQVKIRKGIDLLEEKVGEGPEIEKQKYYRMGLRIWLNKGDPVTWNSGYGTLDENNPIQMADKAQLMISNFR